MISTKDPCVVLFIYLFIQRKDTISISTAHTHRGILAFLLFRFKEKSKTHFNTAMTVVIIMLRFIIQSNNYKNVLIVINDQNRWFDCNFDGW